VLLTLLNIIGIFCDCAC